MQGPASSWGWLMRQTGKGGHLLPPSWTEKERRDLKRKCREGEWQAIVLSSVNHPPLHTLPRSGKVRWGEEEEPLAFSTPLQVLGGLGMAPLAISQSLGNTAHLLKPE